MQRPTTLDAHAVLRARLLAADSSLLCAWAQPCIKFAKDYYALRDSMMYTKAYAAQKALSTGSAHSKDYFGAGQVAVKGLSLAAKARQLVNQARR